MLHFFGIPVHQIESLSPVSNPQDAVIIFKKRSNYISQQIVRIGRFTVSIYIKLLFLQISFAYSLQGTNPKVFRFVDEQRLNNIVTYFAVFGRVILKNDRIFRNGNNIQPVAFGANN